MSVSTKLAAAVVGGLLFATTYAPAWAQSADAKAPAVQSASSPGAGQYMLGVISPLLNNMTQHAAQKSCRAESLYSAHDVIGDPDSCFVSKIDARGPATVGFGIF